MEFAAKWSVYAGGERAEAQTFLNELFNCYGTDRQQAGAIFEDAQHGKFLDLIWRPHCIFEMKRPSEADKLAKHRAQAFEYWRNASDAKLKCPSPRFVVLCAFRHFEIWEPGAFPDEPRADFDLTNCRTGSTRSCSCAEASRLRGSAGSRNARCSQAPHEPLPAVSATNGAPDRTSSATSSYSRSGAVR